MTLKVKLFRKDTQHEVDEVEVLEKLKKEIEKILTANYSVYDSKIKIYGEIIPI